MLITPGDPHILLVHSPVHFGSWDVQTTYINLQFLPIFCNKTRNTLKFPRYSKQYNYLPSLIQKSSVAITQAWQEWESSKPTGVSEIAMEQKRGLPQNNTNIHHLVLCSPVLSSLWSIVAHTACRYAVMQFQSIFCEEKPLIWPQTHTFSILLFFSVIYSRGPTHPSMMHKKPTQI